MMAFDYIKSSFARYPMLPLGGGRLSCPDPTDANPRITTGWIPADLQQCWHILSQGPYCGTVANALLPVGPRILGSWQKEWEA